MSAPILADLARLASRLPRALEGLVIAQRRLIAPVLFRKLLFAWLFLHTALLVPYHREIWAPEAFVQRYPFAPADALDWLLTLSRSPGLEEHYLVFVGSQLVVLALGFFGVWPRLMTVLAYLLTMNLNSLAGVILDGGNNLAQLVLFFLIFVNTSGRPIGLARWPTLRAALVGASNLGFALIRLQIVLVYFCAGLYKLNGQLWQNGMALYYILQADSYSHPLIHEVIIDWPAISLVGTYMTLAFQVLFPVLVWSSRARPLLLTFGVMLHLSISFGMGLFTFGLVMCVMYSAFLEEATCARLLRIGGKAPLVIVDDPHSAHIARLCALARRLDRRRILGTLPADALDPSAPAPAPGGLRVVDPGRGEVLVGGDAVRELLVRPLLAAPLAPLVSACWYLGGLDWIHRRLSRGGV